MSERRGNDSKSAESVQPFLPATSAWFEKTFPDGPTTAQTLAWTHIARGENVLLVSPTGTGKTLAAFLVALDRLAARKLEGDTAPRVSTVYISPLKALDNDVARNLEGPRTGLTVELAKTGATVTLDAAVRTGDTTQAARASQLKTPPDVLITTPESLALLLVGKGRRILDRVDTLILDEIHSVAGTKRGVHLALTLERLEALIASRGGKSPQRIALSATVEPVREVAQLAAGTHRKITPLVVKTKKTLDLSISSPLPEGESARDSSAWGPAIEEIAREVEGRKTTLVFCNNRRHAERVSALLEEQLRASVPTHHGSVARAHREEIERELKAGSTRVLVATGSLELGVDIGSIDSVVLLSSPKGIARALQRVGRSGHGVGETSRGRFVPLFAEDLLECAAVVEGMRAGKVEDTRPPEFPLDVLAQQLVAEAVSRQLDGTSVTSEELFTLVTGAYPYRNLSKLLFVETLAMLSGKYPPERFASLAPKLVWDRARDLVSPLPSARLAVVLDGGTIPDRGAFKAVLRDRKTIVGELDEEFVYELRAGDVFFLGARTWRASEIQADRVVVEDAAGAPAARMPFWRGEGLGRTPELGERLGALKRAIAEKLEDPGLPRFLAEGHGCTEGAAAVLTGAIRREVLESGGVASDRRIIFETFPNDLGDPCVVVRSCLGRGVNLPWSLALAGVLREETGVDVEAVASDDGILLRIPRAEREIPLERLARITAAEARERLLAQLPNSPLFGARFRENAQRALLLPRARAGRRTPFWLQRLKARDLLQVTRNLPDFPIVAETYRDCLKDLWAYDRLLVLLADLTSGAVERVLLHRTFPSPAAKSLLFQFIQSYMYEWDAPKAEKGIHALSANRALLGEVLGEALEDGIRPEAVEEARAEASRLVAHRMARTAEELLLVAQELGDLSEDELVERAAGDGRAWLRELAGHGSLVSVTFGSEARYVVSEERANYEERGDTGLRDILLRYLSARGPASVADLANRYDVPADRVATVLEDLRLEALVVAGAFGEPGVRNFAGMRLAERIRRKTLTILRREIQPVPLTAFRAFLLKRQGVEPGSRFAGAGAAERALALLRALPLPVLAWERGLLAARLAEPEPDAFDVLSARGLLCWRLEGVKDPRAARLSVFYRGEGRFALPPLPPALDGLSKDARRVYDALAVRGALFAPDLAADTGLESASLAKALQELALLSLVTADGFHGLRQMLRKGRRGSAPEPAAKPISAFARPTRAELKAAESRVAQRSGFSPYGPPETPEGRWSLLHAPGVLGPEVREDHRAEGWARLLLARWGVVFRDLVVEHEGDIRWSDLSPALARLELRGDVRRGEFIEGAGPMQFAEPEVVELLRAVREEAPGEDPVVSVVCGADPVLFGLEARPDDWFAFANGALLFRLTGDGALTPEASASGRSLKAALAAAKDLLFRVRDPLGKPRVLSVASIAGDPVLSSPHVPILEGLGFTRDAGRLSYRAL